MGPRQALPPWLLAAAIFALAAAALFSTGAALAASEPVPANYTVVPAGNSSFSGSFNVSHPVWFLLSGNLGDYRSINISGAGPYSIAYLYQPVGNGTRIDAVGGDTTFAGPLGPQSSFHPFYNTTSYYLKLAVWTVAPNYTEDVTYDARFFVGPMPVVRPGTPVTARVYYSFGSSTATGEPMITEDPWLRLDANRHDRVTVTATLADVVQAPTSGPVTFTFWVYTFERPYSGVDLFPNGWMRYITQYGQLSEYWAWQILNASECYGNPCSTSVDFVAPYDGPFFVTLSPMLIPADLQVNVSMAVTPNASLDGNDHVDDAPSVYHVPQVAGVLSYGTDWIDWYRLPLTAGDTGTLTLEVAQALPNTPGNVKDTFELMLLTPDASRAVAVAVMPTAASNASTVSLYLPPSIIDRTGDYLVRVSMIGAGGMIPITCINNNCSGGGNSTLHGHSAYTLSIDQPNGPPAPVSLDLFQNGTEDLPLAIDLGNAFTDPESDPFTYAVTWTSANVGASFEGSHLRLTPPPDFFGRIQLLVTATDWFGAGALLNIDVNFAPTPDAPRVNWSALPQSFGWNRTNWSDPIRLFEFLYDPDGEPLNITLAADSALAMLGCGERCVLFQAVDEEAYGNFTANLTATDPTGRSISLALNLSIAWVNLPPRKAPGSPDVVRVRAGGPVIVLSADSYCFDPDGEDTVLRPASGPLGASSGNIELYADGSDLRILIKEPGGAHAIDLSCADGVQSGEPFTILLDVLPPNYPPFFAETVPLSGYSINTAENTTLTFAAVLTDEDPSNLTYGWALDRLPLTSAHTNATGVYFDFESAGTHNLTLAATDAQGLVATVSWQVEVANTDRPPVCGITALDNRTGPSGTDLVLSSAATDPDGDLLFYLWTANGTLLSDTDHANATLVDGTLVVRLRVTTAGATEQCEVTLTGEADGPAPPPPDGEAGSAADMAWVLGALVVGAGGAGVAFLLVRRGALRR